MSLLILGLFYRTSFSWHINLGPNEWPSTYTDSRLWPITITCAALFVCGCIQVVHIFRAQRLRTALLSIVSLTIFLILIYFGCYRIQEERMLVHMGKCYSVYVQVQGSTSPIVSVSSHETLEYPVLGKDFPIQHNVELASLPTYQIILASDTGFSDQTYTDPLGNPYEIHIYFFEVKNPFNLHEDTRESFLFRNQKYYIASIQGKTIPQRYYRVLNQSYFNKIIDSACSITNN